MAPRRKVPAGQDAKICDMPITQEQAAKLCDVCQSTIQNWRKAGMPVAGLTVGTLLRWLAAERGRIQGKAAHKATIERPEGEISRREKKLEEEIRKLQLANDAKAKELVSAADVKEALITTCATLKRKLEKVGERYGCIAQIIEAVDETALAIQNNRELQND